MKKQPYCVYLFMRAQKATKGEAEGKGSSRSSRLRIEAKAKGKRFFATLPTVLTYDEFQRLFDSKGEWKEGVTEQDKTTPYNKANKVYCEIAYFVACGVVKYLTECGEIDNTTSERYNALVNDLYKRVAPAVVNAKAAKSGGATRGMQKLIIENALKGFGV